MAEVKYLVFSLGNQRFGIDLSNVNGIEEDCVISHAHYESHDIKGVIHLRNMIIPVFDLKRKFRVLQSTLNSKTSLIITEVHGYNLAVEVDGIVGIYVVDTEKDIQSMPVVVRNDENECLVGVMNIDNAIKKSDVVMNIAVDKLLSETEMEDINKAIDDKK